MKMILEGDVMLGRVVKKAIKEYGIDYPMHALSPIFARADLRIINCECAITAHKNRFSGATKAFYFGAPL